MRECIVSESCEPLEESFSPRRAAQSSNLARLLVRGRRFRDTSLALRRYTIGSLILLMFLTSFVGASAFYLAKSMRRSPSVVETETGKKKLDPEALERERQRRATDVAVFSIVTLAIPTVVILILSTAMAVSQLANRSEKKRRRTGGPERDPLIE